MPLFGGKACTRTPCAPYLVRFQMQQMCADVASAATSESPGMLQDPGEMLRLMQDSYDLSHETYEEETMLSIIVVGASGDLARKKIFPALFALYYQGLLPKHVQIVGYARSKTTTEEFRQKIHNTLGCRVDAKYALFYHTVQSAFRSELDFCVVELSECRMRVVCREDCSSAMDSFLQDTSYVAGQYNERESYVALHEQLCCQVCLSSEQIRLHSVGNAPIIAME
jgi:glucose-6-phosphate 1-dehydrogenase